MSTQNKEENEQMFLHIQSIQFKSASRTVSVHIYKSKETAEKRKAASK